MREIADQHERALVTARDRIGDLEAKLERGGGGGGDDASAASDASTDAKVPELQKKLRVAAATVKKLRARETELEEALKAATGGEGGDDAAKAAEAEAAEARTRLDEKAAEVESLSDALEAERESSRSLKLALEEQTAATKKAATAATTAATKELDAERATSSELRAKTQEMAQIIEQLNDALAESHAAEEDARAAEEVRDAMAEQNESALRADVANLTSEARPRSITLVPIPPRSRGERRSLRTLLPGARTHLSAQGPSRRSIPTHTPRRLSTPLLTPMNSTPISSQTCHGPPTLSISERQLLDWVTQIALALDHIHALRVMHRDLKTQNIFLGRGGVVKLGDFGISKVLERTDDFATTVTGTPYYLAPEVCTNQPYTLKSDVWSLGCVAYEIATLRHAFAADSLLSLVYQIVNGTCPPIPTERGYVLVHTGPHTTPFAW